MYAYINGKRIRVDDTDSIGKGGEADVFRVDENTVLKIFKPPTHPDLQGFAHEQKAAEERIRVHQKKLKAFPKGLPATVIAPMDIATDQTGQKIIGYTMRFLRGSEVLMRYSDRKFREAGVSNEKVCKIFMHMHTTYRETHLCKVVFGDNNDLNILVRGEEAYVIDADSFQFGGFYCTVFTEKFVDPLLCNPSESSPMLAKPHTQESDWYAYEIMLMQSLLYVGPYGGVYIPKKNSDKIPHSQRPLKRITVFHPEVKYPKPAIHYNVLPDDLLDRFHKTFVKDARGEFPLRIIEAIRWTSCTACGTIHARNTCPECKTLAPAAIQATTQVRGKVIATRVFKTSGKIIFATLQNNKLAYIYHENGRYLREGGVYVTAGELDPHIRFRIQGESSLLGKNGQIITVTSKGTKDKIATDSFGTLPVFDTNEHARFWANSGQLLRDGSLGQEYIGDMLLGQTLFWVGPTFGFGFYRAGNLSVYFIFDTNKKGINDTLKLPPLRGRMIDSTCFFTKEYCWFFTSTHNAGKIINSCTVMRSDGSVVASISVNPSDVPWLSDIRGKCAAGNFLLSATDEGIVRVEPANGTIAVTREFPDTEPFVNVGSSLFASSQGLYVVDGQEIQLLKIT